MGGVKKTPKNSFSFPGDGGRFWGKVKILNLIISFESLKKECSVYYQNMEE